MRIVVADLETNRARRGRQSLRPGEATSRGRTDRRLNAVLSWFPLVVSLGAGVAAASQPLELSPGGQAVTALEPYLDVFVDDLALLSEREVLAAEGAVRFRALAEVGANFGYTSAAVWLRLSVENHGAVPEERLLELGRAWLEDIRVSSCAVSAPCETVATGARVSFAERAVGHERAIASIRVPPGEGRTVVVRIAGAAPIALRPRLMTPAAFQEHDQTERFWFGMFFGVILLMAIYNLVLSARLREPGHALLGTAIIAYLGGELAAHGFLAHFLPLSGATEFRISGLLFGAFGTIFGAFCSTTLELRRHAPWLHRVVVALAVVSAGVGVASAVHPPAHFLVFVSIAIMAPLGLVCGVVSLSRVSGASYFLVGASVFILPALPGIAEILGLLPLRTWTEHSTHAGSVAFCAALSLALSDKIDRVHRATARFVPHAFLDHLGRRRIGEVELGDNLETEMTVLFSDIRSFTTLSEHRSARATFDFVNGFLGCVVPVIRANGGFVDKFIGDAVMALFPGSPDDALRAAIGMHASLEAMRGSGGPAIQIGVGAHFGPVMLGIIGEPERLSATVLSDAVNLASRIEGLTRTYGVRVIVSEGLVDRLRAPSNFVLRRLGATQVKGRATPVVLFEVLDAEPPAIRALRAKTRADLEPALGALEAGRLDEAREGLARVLEQDPSDPVALAASKRFA